MRNLTTMRRLILTAALLFGLAAPAWAGWDEAKAEELGYRPFIDSGNELLMYCESEDVLEEKLCSFYIAGVYEGNVFTSITDAQEMPHCVPKGVRTSQLARVVVKFLNQRPERLHDIAAGLVIEAIGDAFPCE